MENIIYWENCHVTSRKLLWEVFERNKVRSSDIRGLWKKKKDDFKEPVNTEENIDTVDILVNTATVDFGCASSSSQ